MTTKEIHELSTDECRGLLQAHHVGRLAFLDQVGVLPMILPVNYLLHGPDVVFRSDPGSKLTAAVHDAPVAFEVDGIDHRHQTGWSVVVRGHVHEVTDPADLEHLRSTPLSAWAPGAKSHYLKIVASRITGRRISLADLPANWLG